MIKFGEIQRKATSAGINKKYLHMKNLLRFKLTTILLLYILFLFSCNKNNDDYEFDGVSYSEEFMKTYKSHLKVITWDKDNKVQLTTPVLHQLLRKFLNLFIISLFILGNR